MDAEHLDSLQKRLRWARDKRGLTQEQLAAASGVKQSDISKMERGRSQATTRLVPLAKALGANPEWLDTGAGDWEAVGKRAPSPLTFLQLDGLEGQLVTLFRGLPTKIQERVIAAVNDLHNKAHPARSPANPYPDAPRVSDVDSAFGGL